MAAVTLADLKAHLNLTTDQDDQLLTGKLEAASVWVAAYTGADPGLDATPAAINEAILQIAAGLYENRESSLVGATAQQLPFSALDLLAPYRAFSF
ncbi:head-tail connector protein [Bradyrhizobium sp. DASA03120]|uniref:head-tail connector protein n=1 Tax=Bradyrhizobium sp. SMVTL-02 TaxID=3395917 RepID=UPI003F6EBEA6